MYADPDTTTTTNVANFAFNQAPTKTPATYSSASNAVR